MVIFGEAEWVETSDIGKGSKNNFPFEKGELPCLRGAKWFKASTTPPPTILVICQQLNVSKCKHLLDPSLPPHMLTL